MAKKATSEEPEESELEPILDHFTPGEPGLYTHADAIARAAAYQPPPDETAIPEASPDVGGSETAPADAGS